MEGQVKTVEELRDRLEEQCRVSKQLLESLEDMRVAKGGVADEVEMLKGQLSTEQQASKQRGQALDEAKRLTAELDARIEGLNGQLSVATQGKEELRNTTREAEIARATLVQELGTAKGELVEEQEKTEKLRTEITDTQAELARLQATLEQTQDLQNSLQANADQAAAHNSEVSSLHERIREPETQLLLPFSKRLKKRAKKIVEGFRNSIGVPGRTKLILPVMKREGETH